KTKAQLIKIIESLLKHNEIILITRIDKSKANAIIAHYPQLEYYTIANIVCTPIDSIEKTKHYATNLCAGTSDFPIAEEAAITA
ncbi:1-(5-phosphoribosyl)-5-amino-4-imidazole-carboxylate carboxylase, partial [Enterobacter mori]